ncbi:SDR family NAD(P)-dependent oxidoreductase [Geomicrobium sp. JCM 19038]|uniref:SDR family NAD(P)-dependent oxidoreductase n=1 Tax=Geomicrobium sp. JCM 19038 TaxID=1460635 RepID=UPI00045F4DC0|nr:SDR family oxidoreductase [Geomicrobium sp. JCM 19038]GAK09587.1 dehydrogenase [Geomicrobium sp. JCM 19038]
MSRFNHKVAVITGAGSGIGEALAKIIARDGGTVVLVGRTESKLENVANAIREEVGEGRAVVHRADVTKSEDIEALTSVLQERYGSVDVLVNNAGGSSNKTNIFEMSEDDWVKSQDVNLKSVFLVSKSIGQLMKNNDNQKDRAIVNVASLSGHKAGAHIPHYSAAKAAVMNFSRALAYELAPYQIRVNSVSPGFARTDLTSAGLTNDRFVKAIEKNTALSRVGTADEIANVIAFAASSEASYMTGSDLLVDGGWLLT